MKQICIIVICLLFIGCKKEQLNNAVSGSVFGTSFSIIYDASTDYEKQFDDLFYAINKSMSTYMQDSDISKINRGEVVEVDAHFLKVFESSKIVYDQTNGAFDPTIGAVVNAWDFGPEGKIVSIDSTQIDSLMASVGLKDVVLNANNSLQKKKNTYLDFNAIAKGYAVDVVGEFLEKEGIENYLVEIGGEIRARGINVEKQQPWKVGIDLPNFEGQQELYSIIPLENEAMATSGTYRKFKIDADGNRYAHIIDTKTGYPSKTNILSVSVIAESCMIADAYATAFQAMGIEKVKTLLESLKGLKVMMIFADENNELQSIYLNDFPKP